MYATPICEAMRDQQYMMLSERCSSDDGVVEVWSGYIGEVWTGGTSHGMQGGEKGVVRAGRIEAVVGLVMKTG